jgi:hypothetical protein
VTQCAGCHSLINPIGYAFEHLDFAARTVAGADTSGSLDGVPFSDLAELERALASTPSVADCASRRMIELALGRPAGADDLRAQRALGTDAAPEELDLRVLLERVATTDAFRLRRFAEGAAPAITSCEGG